ncbi:MAG: hypothetical protein MJ078_07795, partial [Clostridia bacterium]|nr:hypothetical protein [Clostridia bacterium]
VTVIVATTRFVTGILSPTPRVAGPACVSFVSYSLVLAIVKSLYIAKYADVAGLSVRLSLPCAGIWLTAGLLLALSAVISAVIDPTKYDVPRVRKLILTGGTALFAGIGMVLPLRLGAMYTDTGTGYPISNAAERFLHIMGWSSTPTATQNTMTYGVLVAFFLAILATGAFAACAANALLKFIRKRPKENYTFLLTFASLALIFSAAYLSMILAICAMKPDFGDLASYYVFGNSPVISVAVAVAVMAFAFYVWYYYGYKGKINRASAGQTEPKTEEAVRAGKQPAEEVPVAVQPSAPLQP